MGSNLLSVSNPYFMSVLNNDKNIPFVTSYRYSYLDKSNQASNTDAKTINRIMIKSTSTGTGTEVFSLSKLKSNIKTLIQNIDVSMNGITEYNIDITLNDGESLVLECNNSSILTTTKFECTMLAFGTLIN